MLIEEDRPRVHSYTVYPSWFGGIPQAEAGMRELADRAAKRRGWHVAGITLTADGWDDRGDRYLATVDYRPRVPYE